MSKQTPKAILSIVSELNAGKQYGISAETTIIGRDDGADVALTGEEHCSRQHARIIIIDDQFIISDLDSANGTSVNGSRIMKPTVLTQNDRIRIGMVDIQFTIAELQNNSAEPENRPGSKTVVKKDLVPSRVVLNEASTTNRQLGHENLGFLSEEHGFMPCAPPILALPPMYKAWDELAERMPELHRNLSVRPTFDALPVLDATEQNLPDKYLLRASALMGIFGYVYYRIHPEPPTKLPDSIMLPWKEITRRLNRPGPVLSYIDLIIYNWKLTNPQLADPVQVENMELLVPTVDNVVERIFYLGQVEILSKLTPAVGAIVRAQEAVDNDDPEMLIQELLSIAKALNEATYTSLMKIKLNPYSGPYYVDTVVWAKTVGPLAVSIEEGVPGPSGIASPIFHLLDEFFGRATYTSRLGEEMTHIREWYPTHWQKFLSAISKISVADYVANSSNTVLKGIFQNTTQAYIAETGFLGRHRLKVYGFLETAFKVGRNVTIGSFSGKFEDRAWDQVHTQLNASRLERDNSIPQFYHHAIVEKVNTLSTDGENWVKQIVLNVEGTGVDYQAGDRCAILPENSDAAVDRILKALRARGNEPVDLTLEWRQAIKFRKGYEHCTTLPLRSLLTFGRIRPVDRSIAKSLYRITHSEKLKHIVEARAEDQWDLADILELATEIGFNPRRLWKSHRGEQEYICQIVLPESFRMYSISSIMEEKPIEGASQLHLTIGRLRYETKDGDFTKGSERFGTSSNYLGDTSDISVEDMGPVCFQIIHPPRFSLPADPSVPIVMFAGGTGFAPFRSFILQRETMEDPTESWLFLGTRTREDIYYLDELEKIAAKGNFNFRVSFSREDTSLKLESGGEDGRFVFGPGTRNYIEKEMLTDENALSLWNLIRRKKDGGKGAYIYVCGRTTFASAVMEGIKAIIYRFSEGSHEEKSQTVQRELYRLLGEERYLQEIFTTYTGSHTGNRKSYNASEVALHNNEENGYWMIIDGRVYDLTEFAHLHPGGLKLIHEYCGMDGTQAYQKILHHENPEIDSWLGMYEIGVVRRLKFGMSWGTLIGSEGLESITLASGYRVWMRYLYLVLELENSLVNEYTIQDQPTTREESPNDITPYKAQLKLQIFKRFRKEYICSIVGEPLKYVWAITSGLCAPGEDVRWISNTIDEIENSTHAKFVNKLDGELDAMLESLLRNGAQVQDEPLKQLESYFGVLEEVNKNLMYKLRMTLLNGIRVFEELESNTITLGGERLLESIKSVPEILDEYYRNMAISLGKIRD